MLIDTHCHLDAKYSDDPGALLARAREVGDSGIVLARPDQHVAWRRATIADDPVADLRRVMTDILDRRAA